MKNKRLLIISVIVVLIVVIGMIWAIHYVSYGVANPFGSASCGADFDSGFQKAVSQNNPAFCLTADLEHIHQYKGLKGNLYCSVPQTGLMQSEGAISTGDVSGCLQAMVEATHDVKACTLLPHEDLCYFTLARITGDQSYCDQISTAGNEPIKRACLSRDDQTFQGIISPMDGNVTHASLALCDKDTNCSTARPMQDYSLVMTNDTSIMDKDYNYTSLASLVGHRVLISGIIDATSTTIQAHTIKEIRN